MSPRLRTLLGVLTAWDLGIGIWALFAPTSLESALGLAHAPDPWVRFVGLLWVFVACIQFRAMASNLGLFSESFWFSMLFRVMEGAMCIASAFLAPSLRVLCWVLAVTNMGLVVLEWRWAKS